MDDSAVETEPKAPWNVPTRCAIGRMLPRCIHANSLRLALSIVGLQLQVTIFLLFEPCLGIPVKRTGSNPSVGSTPPKTGPLRFRCIENWVRDLDKRVKPISLCTSPGQPVGLLGRNSACRHDLPFRCIRVVTNPSCALPVGRFRLESLAYRGRGIINLGTRRCPELWGQIHGVPI